MPFVHVRITPDGVTREKKARIIAEITQTLVSVLNKKPEQTHIVIDEIDTDNWGFCGMLTTDYRRMRESGSAAAKPKPARTSASSSARAGKRRKTP